MEYFVSYYDYYTPEAYVARTDTYIEKESAINEQIDRMRHSATRSLLERDDVVVVASVSCIYGIGDVETYSAMAFQLKKGQRTPQRQLLADLVALHYKRNDQNFVRGTFRVRGDTIELFPSHFEDRAWRISLFGDEIESDRRIRSADRPEGRRTGADQDLFQLALRDAEADARTGRAPASRTTCAMRLAEFNGAGRLLEAQRLEQRTMFDIEMMMATGSCAGIENYSRYLTGRKPGEPPPTLFEYLPDNALVFIDESHVTIPQIGGMFRGDFNRKATLAEYGFRLPSCIDNRPLRFEEWDAMRPQTVCVSATPGGWEMKQTGGVFAEQVIRPTGLIDPPVEIRPVKTQVDDLVDECRKVALAGYRTLVTTLTKRMAEDLTEYMHEQGIRVRYMHSDIDTLERIEIIRDLRLGAFDVLIGINLLREGLDIPECALVAILDADKEGFLRSETSLIQTIGRAARNVDGKVILYADKITGSMERAIAETDRRREKQVAYNEANGITPHLDQAQHQRHPEERLRAGPRHARMPASKTARSSATTSQKVLADMEKRMREAAANLEFEEAARLRDEVKRLKAVELAVMEDPTARQSAIEDASASWPEGKPKPRRGGLKGGQSRARGRGGGRSANPLPSPARGRGWRAEGRRMRAACESGRWQRRSQPCYFPTMTKLEKIEQDIASLSASDVAKLAEWFAEFHADLWDKQIEDDAKSGRLDALANQAMADHWRESPRHCDAFCLAVHSGRVYRELPGSSARDCRSKPSNYL